MAVSTFYYIMLSKDHAICQPIVIGLSFTKIIKKTREANANGYFFFNWRSKKQM